MHTSQNSLSHNENSDTNIFNVLDSKYFNVLNCSQHLIILLELCKSFISTFCLNSLDFNKVQIFFFLGEVFTSKSRELRLLFWGEDKFISVTTILIMFLNSVYLSTKQINPVMWIIDRLEENTKKNNSLWRRYNLLKSYLKSIQ